MNSIILLGAGGHCKSCIDVIENSNEFVIKGIITKPNDSIKNYMNYKILGNDNELGKIFSDEDYGLICIGELGIQEKRIRLYNLLIENNLNIAVVRSNYAIISKNAKINKGSVIMHNVVVNSGVNIGENCVINTNSVIEHDVIIDDHSYISTGVIINGGVQIGKGSFIGSGSIIREGLKIPPNSIISAGKRVMGWPLK